MLTFDVHFYQMWTDFRDTVDFQLIGSHELRVVEGCAFFVRGDVAPTTRAHGAPMYQAHIGRMSWRVP